MSTIDPLIALGVLVATGATDAVYVMFTSAVIARRRVPAATWSSVWYILSSYAVISYTENWMYVAFAAAGSWLGAYLTITFLHRPGDRRRRAREAADGPPVAHRHRRCGLRRPPAPPWRILTLTSRSTGTIISSAAAPPGGDRRAVAGADRLADLLHPAQSGQHSVIMGRWGVDKNAAPSRSRAGRSPMTISGSPPARAMLFRP
jgi:hypothetical protein